MLTKVRYALIRLIAGSDLAVVTNMRFEDDSILPTHPGRGAMLTGCHFDFRKRREAGGTPLYLGS